VSGRELEVLDAVAEGLTNAEIAARLCVSERTVESHVASLMRKLGARNRVEVARCRTPRTLARGSGDRVPPQLDAIARRGRCVGRDAELQRLLECWEAAESQTTMAIVRGEAGIGKSRLAADVAMEVHRRGGGVALGVCSDGPQRPYEPFMFAIEAEAAHLSDIELNRRLGTSRVTFARLSRDMATRLGAVKHDGVDPERDRVAVHEALGDYLSRSARARQLLFVIEDLHWASIGTRDVVAHIGRFGGDAPLMLLITTRDERPFVDDDFSALLGRLAGLPSVETIALSGLDVTAAATVIAAMGGDLDPDEGVRQTGGNPLYLRELAREGAGSRSLVELVADRFNRLSPGDLDVLDVAAVAGEQIDVPLLASALERDNAAVLDALERAKRWG
jgi:predicted ATPase